MSDDSSAVGPQQFAMPLLLTINQVAALLNIGRTKTYEIIRSNKMKSIKVGSRRLVPRDAVERYVAEVSNDQLDDWN